MKALIGLVFKISFIIVGVSIVLPIMYFLLFVVMVASFTPSDKATSISSGGGNVTVQKSSDDIN